MDTNLDIKNNNKICGTGNDFGFYTVVVSINF